MSEEDPAKGREVQMRVVRSVLRDIRTITLDFARLRRPPTETSLSGAFGVGLLGAGFGPLGAAAGMILGMITGEVVETRLRRREQQSSGR